MAYKTNKSPIKQGWAGSIMGNIANQVQVPPPTASTNNGYLWGMGGAGTTPQTTQAAAIGAQQQPSISGPSSQETRVPAAASIIAPRPATVRPSRAGGFNSPEMISNTINPKAFSNSKAISGVYGRANKGTFTRTVQNNESPMMQLANPGMLQDGPQLPPQSVQTSVTPTLGFENS